MRPKRLFELGWFVSRERQRLPSFGFVGQILRILRARIDKCSFRHASISPRANERGEQHFPARRILKHSL